ncbi:MAG TPA: hypothetical protein VLT87_15555, partial [Thermoanaerobaculia bacterium]|nr:hypothetical protein [Thermoanaerobaculia bacterium]
LARPVPGGSHLSVALFDAGPGQLGSPRIAQLAALIVLARRAEAAGVRFGWGILQEPDEPLLTAVTPASVLRLLQSRTPHEATDAQIEAWHERLDGWRERDDAWIVGARRLGGLPMGRSASHLQVWDVLDPRVRRVGVTVIRGSLPPREIALDLPEEDACVRLLRDPFGATVAPPERSSARIETSANPVFSDNGTKLFLRTRTGGVLAIPVPNSPRAKAGRPRLYEVGEEDGPVVAAGLWNRSVALLTLEDGAADLHHFRGKKGGVRERIRYPGAPGEESFQGGPGARLQPLLTEGRSPCAVDARGTLFAFFDSGNAKSILRLGAGVLAASSSRFTGMVIWVEASAEGRPARLRQWGSGDARTTLSLKDCEAGQAFFGQHEGLSRPYHLVAVQRDDRAWSIFSSNNQWDLTPPSGDRVVGVGSIPRTEGPGLLVLDKDRRTLLLTGRNWTRTLPAASADVEHVTVSPSTGLVAWSTVAGEVVVYSPRQDAIVARRLPEGEA